MDGRKQAKHDKESNEEIARYLEKKMTDKISHART